MDPTLESAPSGTSTSWQVWDGGAPATFPERVCAVRLFVAESKCDKEGIFEFRGLYFQNCHVLRARVKTYNHIII